MMCFIYLLRILWRNFKSEPSNNAFDQKISIGKLDYDAEINKVQSDIDDIKNFITLFLNIKNRSEY